jgi:hypothetical protein
MDGHVVAVAANVPVRGAEIGGRAAYPVAIAVGVTGKQAAGRLEIRRPTKNTGVVEGTSASRYVRPSGIAAEAFARSIGAAHDHRRVRRARGLAYVDHCSCVGWRRERIGCVWPIGRASVDGQAACQYSTASASGNNDKQEQAAHAAKPKADLLIPPQSS